MLVCMRGVKDDDEDEDEDEEKNEERRCNGEDKRAHLVKLSIYLT